MELLLSPKLQKSKSTVIKNHHHAAAPATITLNSKKIITILCVCVGILVMLSLVASYLMVYNPDNLYSKKYIEFFYLNNENNLPSLFSTMLLFIASLLNFAIYSVTAANPEKKKYKFYWFILGAVFLFLGLDESLQIHELLNNRDSIKAMETENLFVYYGWVIPYAIGSAIIGIFFLRFVFSLPVNIRNRFMIAGFIYVFAALGMECLESLAHNLYGDNSFLIKTLITIEEPMEMSGVIIFIYALLDYVKLSKVVFVVSEQEDTLTVVESHEMFPLSAAAQQ